jgi:site-specific DNA-methyltransferase (adenine-specific)
VKPWLDVDGVTVFHGDCIEVMRQLPDDSLDSIVTSPPYAMQRSSTYGGVLENEYPEWTVKVFSEFQRILKPQGSIMWNISPHVRNGQLADYVLKMRFALRANGWFEHDELIWVKPDKMPTGRANWPKRSWESVFWYSRTKNPYANAKANGNLISEKDRLRALNRRNAFQGRDARLGWDHLPKGSGKTGEYSRGKNWISIAVRSIRNETDHPAPFPLKLAQWMMKFNTPPGGTVLDPFAGSGTTIEACVIEGFNCIAIEREADYLPLIEARLNRPIQAAL